MGVGWGLPPFFSVQHAQNELRAAHPSFAVMYSTTSGANTWRGGDRLDRPARFEAALAVENS